MKAFVSLLCGLGLLQTFVTGASIPKYFEEFPTTRRTISSAQVQAELGQEVSDTTVIYGQEDAGFAEATTRWSSFAMPHIQVVVVPRKESDVAKIVKFCNKMSIPFLAINRGHGHSASLNTFNGIQINMGKLDRMDIQPSGKSVWFGGGVFGGPVSRYLWDRGYVTTHGSCDCVGLVGAGLGGGHGRHEGLYGMVVDNMLELNVVLANGTAVRVSSTSHSDLLWGMKGAGHNFGIVTSFEMKIYPRGPDTWHYHNYIWTGDKLDAVFNALNDLHGNGATPPNMAVNFGNTAMNTDIDAKAPVMTWSFAYRGSAEEAEALLAPFNAIGSAWDQSGDVPYPQVATAQSTGESDFVCTDMHEMVVSTAGTKVYNLTSERLIYEGFRRRAAADPALVAGASIVHEGYSTAAVTAQNADDTAYPFRDDHHLMLFNAISSPGNETMNDALREWADEARDLWNAGEPGRNVDAYVNYASGYESVEELYGHEPWRLERLRGLKAAYDPNNRFRYFNPIIRS